MKNMLIIGRFQPFHLGHLEIIKRYHRKGFFIKIVIGSTQKAHQRKNPFTTQERVVMIKKSLEDHKIKNFEILFVPDLPCDSKWLSLIKKKTGKIDVLFTGNPWVKKLFKNESLKIHEYKEKFERIKGIKAEDIRKKLTTSKSKKGLPIAVFNHLKIIKAFDRLKDLNDPKKKVHYLLSTNKLSVCTAESCTGGAISRALISYSGSSKFFLGSIIAYNSVTKTKLLGVKKSVIKKYGVVSEEVSKQMAYGALKLFKTNYVVSTTGYADPFDKQAGLVFVTVSNGKVTNTEMLKSNVDDRNKIIDKTTKKAIKMLYELLKKDLFNK